MGQLIQSRSVVDKELHEDMKELEALLRKCFNADGEWVEELEHASEEDRNRVTKKYYAALHILVANLPYIYWGSKDESFTDSYGSRLIVATIEEVYDALVRDQAKTIADKEYDSAYGYRRFHLAIKLLEGFLQDKVSWKNVRVILYGH